RDTVDPGIKRALETEVADIAVGLEKRFLVNVLGILFRAGQVIGEAQHGAIVLAHQFLERGVIASLCFPDQLRVIHAALGLPRHGPSVRGSRGRLARPPPRHGRTEPRAKHPTTRNPGAWWGPRANRERNCYRFGRHAGFYL